MPTKGTLNLAEDMIPFELDPLQRENFRRSGHGVVEHSFAELLLP
eukprot:CAMPEP_0172663510 /NCGR_PEP_ID=MMETSP1074-20121228/5976_1 /TAXON_ID=2916 /ORGANISM="Ceratium fusus, Strain PA161109" /LENGTH=44 /DNA_ID= /DNA_START= /DNA_END= /DNA_ORIENTATION=